MAASIPIRFKDIARKIELAEQRAGEDERASAPLRAVIHELHEKTQKALEHLVAADERTIRDHVIEVEQAADSAHKAAQADADASEPTRRAVAEAHEGMSALKSELLEITSA